MEERGGGISSLNIYILPMDRLISLHVRNNTLAYFGVAKMTKKKKVLTLAPGWGKMNPVAPVVSVGDRHPGVNVVKLFFFSADKEAK